MTVLQLAARTCRRDAFKVLVPSLCYTINNNVRFIGAAHMSAAQSITNQLRQILTPVQVAKFLMWVEKNKRSMDLLNTIGGSE